MAPSFVAIDFETADYGPDSACALGLVRARGDSIVDRKYWLLKPPRREFVFSYLHGITWRQVCRKPSFAELWSEIRTFLDGADFLAAHNARFDRGVLIACCAAAGLPPPPYRFLCTVQLARSAWGIYPTRLPDVCRRLDIALNHHQALSDAEACARIVMAGLAAGAPIAGTASSAA